MIRLALVSGKSRDLRNRILRRKASENSGAEHLSKLFIWACEYLSPHHRKVCEEEWEGRREGGKKKRETGRKMTKRQFSRCHLLNYLALAAPWIRKRKFSKKRKECFLPS